MTVISLLRRHRQRRVTWKLELATTRESVSGIERYLVAA